MKNINKIVLSLSVLALAILPVQANEAPAQDMKMHQNHTEMMKMMTNYENEMKAELKSLRGLKGDAKINKVTEILSKMLMHQEKMHANMKKMHEGMMLMMDKKMTDKKMMHNHK